MKLSSKGITLIQRWEGFKPKAYMCPAGVLTIGFGHTGPDVKPGMVIGIAEGERLFLEDVKVAEDGVLELCKGITLTQGQFDALVSFVYNFGAQKFSKSTLLKKLKAGDKEGAAAEFIKWTKAKDKDGKLVDLPGLVARRKAERERFRQT